MTKTNKKHPDQGCRHDWKEVNQKLGYGKIQLNLTCCKCRCTIVEVYTIDKKYIIDSKGKFIDSEVFGDQSIQK